MNPPEQLLSPEQVEQMFHVLTLTDMTVLQDVATFFPDATQLDDRIYEKGEELFKNDLVYYAKTGRTYAEELDRTMEERGIKKAFDEWSRQREAHCKNAVEEERRVLGPYTQINPYFLPQAYRGFGAKLAYLYFPQLREESRKNRYLRAKLAIGLSAFNDGLNIQFGFMWSKIEDQAESRTLLAQLLKIDEASMNKNALETSNPDEMMKLFMNLVTSPKFPEFVNERKEYRAKRENRN